MSQFEDSFMAGFNGVMSKTAEAEMPVLDKALGNLGLTEEPPAGEEPEMPILKQALENLGLTEEEQPAAEEESVSMLEELAKRHGPAVVAEREKVAAEKTAMSMGGAGAKAKELAGKVKTFASKHPGKFKAAGGAAVGLGAGYLAGRAGKKGKKDKKKKGK
jgi:hypothetical protein